MCKMWYDKIKLLTMDTERARMRTNASLLMLSKYCLLLPLHSSSLQPT